MREGADGKVILLPPFTPSGWASGQVGMTQSDGESGHTQGSPKDSGGRAEQAVQAPRPPGAKRWGAGGPSQGGEAAHVGTESKPAPLRLSQGDTEGTWLEGASLAPSPSLTHVVARAHSDL